MRPIKLWAALALLIVLGACAQDGSLSGGAKDETPPVLIRVTPAAMGLNFSANSFEMEFNEFINVEDFNNQLLISPPIESSAEYKARGKRLMVSWDESLKPNTTYQFNFGEAVKDFTEGNVNNSLLYVFSTGDYIDSLSISGAVYSAQTNEPVEGAKVLLYNSYSDSLPYTTRPNYLAITDDQGKFHARYLPADTFMVFILKEENGNVKYDGAPEQIAFLDYHVSSTYADTSFAHVFALFEEADTSQFVKGSSGKDYGYHEVVFNLPTVQPGIVFYEGESDVELKATNVLNPTGDTLRSWLDLSEKPMLEDITVVVSDGKNLQDTLGWYIEIDPKYREKPKLEVNGPSGQIDSRKPVVLDFNYPLQQADQSLILLYEDSIEVTPDSVLLSNFDRRLSMYYPYSKSKSYSLVANEGAFEDYYGKFSDSLSFVFGLHPDDFYGSLLVNLMLNDSLVSEPFVLELQNDKGAVLKTIILESSQEIDFGRLLPGLYKLKGIFDRNGDGQWTRGNYKEGLQPERQCYYPGEINVRSNWEFDVDWIPATPFDP